ncbi:dipeptidase [Pseudomonas sp. GV071]|uniref:dipeptidase n=1 Tax=Pseudomonas sp. GV071 TaxID=2135754 RepID=UPI000D3B0C37|nr:dipeptidase [Pseudomonas sp. GV071]PTQ74183.1 membrane dipeptidase [Pseudomonas sp. GV071]
MPDIRHGLALTLLLAASAQAADTPRPMLLDSHLDTPMHLARPGWDITARHRYADDLSQVDLPRMRDGGLDGGFWAIFTPQGPRTDEGRTLASEHGLAVLTRIRDMVATHPQDLELALTADDARRISAAGKRVVFISMENAEPLAADPGRLLTYQRLGLRMLGLVHAANNSFADSATALPEWHGLSAQGRELVSEANRLGIVLDVSHASDATFDQVLALSRAPVIASHSGSRVVAASPRNLDDGRLRRLAAQGGVVAINSFGSDLISRRPNPMRDKALAPLYREFRNAAALSPAQVAELAGRIRAAEALYPQQRAGFEDFISHLLHVLAVVGPEHVGIGADWDGGGGVEGMEDVSQLPRIRQRLLAAGYSEGDVGNIFSGNLLRVVASVQQRAGP